jgi:hypothetical protein
MYVNHVPMSIIVLSCPCPCRRKTSVINRGTQILTPSQNPQRLISPSNNASLYSTLWEIALGLVRRSRPDYCLLGWLQVMLAPTTAATVAIAAAWPAWPALLCRCLSPCGPPETSYSLPPTWPTLPSPLSAVAACSNSPDHFLHHPPYQIPNSIL